MPDPGALDDVAHDPTLSPTSSLPSAGPGAVRVARIARAPADRRARPASTRRAARRAPSTGDQRPAARRDRRAARRPGSRPCSPPCTAAPHRRRTPGRARRPGTRAAMTTLIRRSAPPLQIPPRATAAPAAAACHTPAPSSTSDAARRRAATAAPRPARASSCRRTSRAKSHAPSSIPAVQAAATRPYTVARGAQRLADEEHLDHVDRAHAGDHRGERGRPSRAPAGRPAAARRPGPVAAGSEPAGPPPAGAQRQSRHDDREIGRRVEQQRHPGAELADQHAGERRRDQHADHGGGLADPAGLGQVLRADHLRQQRGEGGLGDRQPEASSADQPDDRDRVAGEGERDADGGLRETGDHQHACGCRPGRRSGR